MTPIAFEPSSHQSYYRVVALTEIDNANGYYRGFATMCHCKKQPSPCICNPKLIRTNGLESGDIFFDCRSYQQAPQLTFNALGKNIGRFWNPFSKTNFLF